MMKFRENEDAVSPVIGVILMVAITVILAAVIAAFVFGMTSDMPDTMKNVAIGVKAATGNSITITVQGGSDLPRLEYLTLKVGDDTSATVFNTTTGGGFGADKDVHTSKAGEFIVGSTWKTTSNVLKSGESQRVIVLGVFNDGSEQILTDTYF